MTIAIISKGLTESAINNLEFPIPDLNAKCHFNVKRARWRISMKKIPECVSGIYTVHVRVKNAYLRCVVQINQKYVFKSLNLS